MAKSVKNLEHACCICLKKMKNDLFKFKKPVKSKNKSIYMHSSEFLCNTKCQYLKLNNPETFGELERSEQFNSFILTRYARCKIFYFYVLYATRY